MPPGSPERPARQHRPPAVFTSGLPFVREPPAWDLSCHPLETLSALQAHPALAQAGLHPTCRVRAAFLCAPWPGSCHPVNGGDCEPWRVGDLVPISPLRKLRPARWSDLESRIPETTVVQPRKARVTSLRRPESHNKSPFVLCRWGENAVAFPLGAGRGQ